jgi:hypothetical protein
MLVKRRNRLQLHAITTIWRVQHPERTMPFLHHQFQSLFCVVRKCIQVENRRQNTARKSWCDRKISLFKSFFTKFVFLRIIPVQAGSNKYASQKGMTGLFCT